MSVFASITAIRSSIFFNEGIFSFIIGVSPLMTEQDMQDVAPCFIGKYSDEMYNVRFLYFDSDMDVTYQLKRDWIKTQIFTEL